MIQLFRRLSSNSSLHRLAVISFVCGLLTSLQAQTDWIRTGTNLGVERVRIAAADFKAAAPISNQELLNTFNATLISDLQNAGIFDVVSKSFYPLQQPGTPQEMHLDAWGNPPANAAMVAF
ncbi:MAG TPA: translocation protein TolB, partial [Terriglobales bacterium]